MSLKKREEVCLDDTWDLSRLYANKDEWLKDYTTLEQKYAEILKFKSKLGESAETLLAAIDLYYQNYQIIEKLYCYSHLLADQDTANGENQGLNQKAMNLYGRMAAAVSFIRPELLAIPAKILESFLADSKLKPYARAISEITRYQPYTLDQKGENILALSTEALSSSGVIFSQLNNADLKFGTLLDNGIEKPLTHSSLSVFLRSHNRNLRQSAYSQYMAEYDAHRNTVAATYSASIKKDIFLARARGYESTQQMYLFPDQVPLSVYDNLIKVVTENISTLHRYYELRRKLLKLDKLESYDHSVPLVGDLTMRYSYEEGCNVIIESLAPLGDEYTTVLSEGLLNKRWVDRYENQGKRSGAYQSSCYNYPPYILMNYQEDNIDSVYTLAHEAGHAMHTYFSSKHQSYQDHEYPIFTAEVASTFNEQLLSHHLLSNKITDPLQRAYIINHQIDEIMGTFFRQTLFAEFEKTVHELAYNNQPLTVDVFRKVFGDLLVKYNGPACNLTDLADLNGLRIPHFYSPFYVYKYATGISAAISLSENILSATKQTANEHQNNTARYLNFIQSGCLKPPIELLKDAGVDLNTPNPIRNTITKFKALTEQLEAILG